MRDVLLATLVLLFWLGTGCATPGSVRIDDPEDLSLLRTWDWLPPGPSPEMGVDAPHRDAPLLHARLARLIDGQLRARGYERADPADVYVIYHLVLKPRRVIVQVPRAPYLLSSMSYSPSYWIEGSDEKLRVYEDFRLVIGLMTGPERIVWRGVLDRKVEQGADLALADAVADLLGRLPVPTARPPASPPQRPLEPADPPGKSPRT